MTSQLANLVKAGKLKAEPPDRKEFEGLVRSGRVRLGDAQKMQLSYESRFDRTYNAAHALALAALRRLGYRSENRYIVFQCLGQTLDIAPELWRVLSLAHDRRNIAEYAGALEHDEKLLKDMLRVTEQVLGAVTKLGPPK
jgi:hypothetical protein